GLKTLSREAYVPPSVTDIVIIDSLDPATFNTEAGYYHPQMRMVDGRIIPSSEKLLHEFLRQGSWRVNAHNEMAIYTAAPPSQELPDPIIDSSSSDKPLAGISPMPPTSGNHA